MFQRSRRLWQVLRIARRYRLGELSPRAAPRWLLGNGRGDPRAIGVRIRLALEELGPVFIKFGQAVSTRRDLLPSAIAEELVKLQDQVPPFDGAVAKAMVAQAYGQPVEQVFETFDSQPLAAASIAQVHGARLRPNAGESQGLSVVVKVLRPGVHAAVQRDVALLYLLAEFAARLPETRRLRPREVVAEYERIVTDELDMLREGANASQLRRNWLGSDLIYHPLVDFDHTRANVLVMERISGIAIDDTAALIAAGVDFRVLAERGVEIFFKQVFRDNFFHADMHPGNIFVDVANPGRPRYIGVDFGIVGSLSPSDQRYLAENFLAFFNRDYRRIAELHIASGWMPADTRVEEFEGAIRTVGEPIFNKPLAEISFGMFLIRLFRIARRYHYRVQPQLVLLQKTILNIEGLGRQLYPQLDLWQTAKPILEEWLRARLSPVKNAERLRAQLPLLAEALPQLASQLTRRIAQDASGAPTPQALVTIRSELGMARAALHRSVIAAALVISAVLAAGLDLAMPWSALLLGGAGLVCWWRARAAADRRL